jgi:hypothetical protein
MYVELSVVSAIAFLAAAPSSLLAQVITGRVLELGSNRPIPAASVTLAAATSSLLVTESDSAGMFHVAVPRAGRYTLRIERIGYASGSSETLEVGAREKVDVTICLSVTPIRIEPLLVVERRTQIRPQAEFERRAATGRNSGLGVFITRKDLDSTSAHSVTDLLGRVPFLRLEGENVVSYSEGGCIPTLYLNGASFQFATGESINDLIQPGSLEGVEIYRNRTELPRDFAGIGHCAAILFWTRAGEPSRGASWRLLIAGGGVLGLLVFFIAN